MQYIDKTKHIIKEEAHSFLKAYIDSKWKDTKYIGLSYNSLRRNSLKKGKFRKLLLKEQNYYCCYCMRHILETEATLEHIIPNSATTNDAFSAYVSYGQIQPNVFLWDETSMSSIKIIPPPFPHILAYENLVVSCDGFIPTKGLSNCCNNKRGNNEIIPFFYTKDKFTYALNGMIICNAKYNNTISFLALENETLQLFRRCWLNLPVKYDALDVITASSDVGLRQRIIDDMDFERVNISDRTTMSNSLYWDSFMDYFWFYLYKVEKGI